MQGALDLLGLPYTGSGVLASALGMDKLRTKQVWIGAGLPTPPWRWRSAAEWPSAAAELGCRSRSSHPMKGPASASAGSDDPAQFQAAWDGRRLRPVLVEPWIEGQEYTGSVPGRGAAADSAGNAARVLRLRSQVPRQRDPLSVPCGLPEAREAELRELVRQAFAAVDGAGWGRVDLMVDAQDRPWLLEVNTVPGMTDHSLVPMAARVAGLNFEELVWRILETSLAQPG